MKKVRIVLLVCALAVCNATLLYAQVSTDKEDAALKIKKIHPVPKDYKFSNSIALFSGYDSNVRLLPQRKGDAFEEFIYSLDFVKVFPNEIKILV